MNRRDLLPVLLAALVFAGAASAQSPTLPLRYAVLSAVGDEMTIVYARTQTGSHLDRNDREAMPMPQHALDRLALGHLDKALKRAAPTVEVAALMAANSSLLKVQRQAIHGHAHPSAPVRAFADVLPAGGADRLLLLLKHRGDARIPVRDGSIGQGQLDGVGFYIDRVSILSSKATGSLSPGFLAPYAYVRLVLADASGRSLVERIIEAAETHLMGDATYARQPWELMDANAKVAAIDRLLQREIERELPRLLSSASQ